MNPKFDVVRMATLAVGLITIAACTRASGSLSSNTNIAATCLKNEALCNVVSGYEGNSVMSGAIGATISGGGQPGLPNQVSGNQGAIGGGNGNLAGEGSTVAGGYGNTALFFHATVGGGESNQATGEDTTVGGGLKNIASDRFSTVGGGVANLASSLFTTVSGGSGNTASFDFAAVGGGTQNQATSEAAVVSGGNNNLAQGAYSAILGGINNAANNQGATVGGGAGNVATGSYAVIPGGFANQAAGDYSFAAGREAKVAADHPGTFLFADSNTFQFPSMAPNEFAVRATGGVRFVTAVDPSGNSLSGVRLSPGGGSWENLSDSQAKAGITPVDGRQVLDRLMSLPISTWSYRSQDPTIRHIGPMAQDFYSAFQVGDDTHYISTVDEDGVALAAIQELYRLVQHGPDQGPAPLQSGDFALQEQIASLKGQLTFSNGLAIAALLAAILALWQRKKGTA